jgi:hypothetical protein
VSPSWSPVGQYGGYAAAVQRSVSAVRRSSSALDDLLARVRTGTQALVRPPLGAFGPSGCDCFAF